VTRTYLSIRTGSCCEPAATRPVTPPSKSIGR